MKPGKRLHYKLEAIEDGRGKPRGPYLWTIRHGSTLVAAGVADAFKVAETDANEAWQGLRARLVPTTRTP